MMMMIMMMINSYNEQRRDGCVITPSPAEPFSTIESSKDNHRPPVVFGANRKCFKMKAAQFMQIKEPHCDLSGWVAAAASSGQLYRVPGCFQISSRDGIEFQATSK